MLILLWQQLGFANLADALVVSFCHACYCMKHSTRLCCVLKQDMNLCESSFFIVFSESSACVPQSPSQYVNLLYLKVISSSLLTILVCSLLCNSTSVDITM